MDLYFKVSYDLFDPSQTGLALISDRYDAFFAKLPEIELFIALKEENNPKKKDQARVTGALATESLEGPAIESLEEWDKVRKSMLDYWLTAVSQGDDRLQFYGDNCASGWTTLKPLLPETVSISSPPRDLNQDLAQYLDISDRQSLKIKRERFLVEPFLKSLTEKYAKLPKSTKERCLQTLRLEDDNILKQTLLIKELHNAILLKNLDKEGI